MLVQNSIKNALRIGALLGLSQEELIMPEASDYASHAWKFAQDYSILILS
jgi:hypothetical protein